MWTAAVRNALCPRTLGRVRWSLLSVWVTATAAWRSHRDAASEGAAKQHAAPGPERRQQSRYRRGAEIGKADLGRGNEEPRTQRGRADETNEAPKSGAQNSIRQCTLPA